MVEVEEINETGTGESEVVSSPSTERRLDAEEIESTLSYITRPTARAQIEALVTKIKRDAAAIKRMEASQTVCADESASRNDAPTDDNSKSVSPAINTVMQPPKNTRKKYLPIETFSFDAGGYNTPTVTLYIPLPSPSPTKVECSFTNASFDLQIQYDDGAKAYRLFKDNLEKDIDGDKCKYVVKSNKVVIKLRKVKGEYGSYDSWTTLTAKATAPKKKSSKSEDPSASIMNMMKDMYESGDDNMKKMIGETMMKQREGKLGDGDGGMGGMGGM